MSTHSVNVSSSKRFHPVLVILHWLIAILIFGAVFLVQENEGSGERSRPPGQGYIPQQVSQQANILPQGGDSDDAPQMSLPAGLPIEKSQNIFSAIGVHMIFGFLILALLIVRLIVRWTTKHPEWASTGNKFFDWVGGLTHFGLYFLTFAMTITGIILADKRGILAETFGFGSAPTRGGFSIGFLHGAVWALLLLLILVHVGAALYHQFILKDNLMERIWLGKRTE